MVRPSRVFSFQRILPVVFGAAIFAAAVSGRAQSAPPAPAPPNAPVPTIRTYSNIVVIDVVVTDAQGKPVQGLPASAFSLTEDKKSQALRHFEEHDASPAGTQIAEPPKLPPGLFSNRPPAPANGPVNVLLLDYLNTPLTSQPHARQQLIDYLNKAPAGTRIAIFGLTTRLVMLQGFTSDMKVLKTALLQTKGTPQASDILTNPVGGGPIGYTELSDALANDPAAVEGMVTQEMVDSINRFEAVSTSFQQDLRAKYTLNAFDMLARYLVGIPGRKNVIWFSGGFPLDIEPNVNEADPNDSVVRNDEEVRKTDNLLTQAQVAVYPVDSRGVQTDPSQQFGNQTTADINAGSGAAAAAEQMDFLTTSAQEHETMEAMAEDTGGKPFYNTNDLTKAVSSAIENGSNYYTLTYSPTNTQWDERFRSIKVKVDQPGVKLSYREGYYAVDPNNRNRVAVQGAATTLVQPNTMATAMMHGGPEASEILFKVRIRPSDTPPSDTVLKTNQANPDPKVKVQGPYKAYGVDLVPDAKAVSCEQGADGNHHCSVEVWTFVYNTDGEKLITVSNRLHTKLTPAEYTRLLAGGMAFHQEISVPVKGQYFLRTAIHDMTSDRVGSVELPVAAVVRLEPLKTMASSAPAAAAPATPPATK